MKRKSNSDKHIKRRLTVMITAAVFVFTTCFYPFTGIYATEDETSATSETENTTEIAETSKTSEAAVTPKTSETTATEKTSETTATEKTAEPSGTVETDEADDVYIGGMGYHTIDEIKERVAVESGDEPTYVQKKERKLKASQVSQYLPWEKEYYKGHVRIMYQGNTDTCWAYTACTAAQISYLKELYDKGTSTSKSYQLSPTDFAYFFYYRQSHPYGYTAKDKNTAKKNYLKNGGNNYMSALAMSGWMGMHSEADESHAAENAYNNSLVLENAVFFNDNIKYVSDEHNSDTECTVLNEQIVKDAIKKYGALAADIYIDNSYMKESEEDNYKSCYCNYEGLTQEEIGSSNHAVTLIGWDDTFPKENFRTQPSRDGAWIAQNSWGPDDTGGGFLYISYDDLSLSGAIAFDMQKAGIYDANYQYDGNAYTGFFEDDMNSQFANVFTVPDDNKRHTLKAVGLTTWNEMRTTFKIKIYRKVGTTPTTGKLVDSFNVSTDYGGCYTFRLSDYGVDPVYLNTGEKYAVLVQPTSTKELDGLAYIGLERDINRDWIRFESAGKAKKCYYRPSIDYGWTDLYSHDTSASFRIKAFTTTTDRRSISKAKVAMPVKNYNYGAEYRKPRPKVSCDGKTLSRDISYTLTYSNNKYPGTATVTIKGIGLYKGTIKRTFTIGAMKNFRKSYSTTKSITLKWDKSPKVTGYKIYRYKSGKYKLIKTITKNTTTKITDKKLKSGVTYKYKIRTYKKVGDKKYFGPYSKILKAKTK